MSARDDYPQVRAELVWGEMCEEIDRLRNRLMSKTAYISSLEYELDELNQILRRYQISAALLQEINGEVEEVDGHHSTTESHQVV